MHNINLPKVVPALLARYLRKYKLPFSGVLEQDVNTLNDHQAKLPADNAARCDICQGVSDGDLPECPYCGSTDNEETTTKDQTMATKKTTTPKPAATPKPVKEAKLKPVTEKVAKTAKKTAVKKKDPKDEARKAAAKQVRESLAAVAAAAPKDHSDATIVQVKATPDGGTEVLSSKTLDREVKAIQKAQRTGAEAMYEVGQRLRVIEDQSLFTLRTGKDKKPQYRSFQQFCDQELGLTKKYAQRIIDVVKRFSEQEVSTIGVTKLWLIANVQPGEEFDHLLSAVKEGASREQIEAEIKRLNPAKQMTERQAKNIEDRPNTPRGSELKEAPAQSDTLTAVGLKAEVSLEFVTDLDAPATSLAQDVYATELCANGVEIHYVLYKDEETGRIKLDITRKRG